MRSLLEIKVAEYVKSLLPKRRVFYNVRNILPFKREIDIYVPYYKRGLEVNGDLWHSNSALDYYYGVSAEEYHQRKYLDAVEKGVDLGFVWEYDLITNRDKVYKDIKKFILKGEGKEFRKLVGPRDNTFTIDDVLDAEEKVGKALLKSFVKETGVEDVELWGKVVKDFIAPRVATGFVFRLNTGYISYKLNVVKTDVDKCVEEAVVSGGLIPFEKGFVVDPVFVVGIMEAERENLEIFEAE